ncbi:MAG: DNA-binding protein [Candidatus Micrarchaeota archaeon]|nr:DNA-binding protein [Candidatus Micrarchaeota archaeon]
MMERTSKGEMINENISMITAIEYPMIFEYDGFCGKILYPEFKDLRLAFNLQKKLERLGRMKGAADLIIAAMCINYSEVLITLDMDFYEIARISSLRMG